MKSDSLQESDSILHNKEHAGVHQRAKNGKIQKISAKIRDLQPVLCDYS